MVVIQRRFTLLAALTTIAAVSVLPPSALGAVVPADYKEVDAGATTTDAHHSTHSHSLTHTESADHAESTSSEDNKDGKAQRQQQPVLPLPTPTSDSPQDSASDRSQDTGGDEDKHHKDKRDIWDEADYGHHAEVAWLATHDDYVDRDMKVMRIPHRKRHDHDYDHDRHHEVVVNGDHDDVHMHRRTFNSRLRSRAPSGVAEVEGGALPHILPDEGLDRRSPHDRHHGEVVVNGHDDHVHVHRSVHERRMPRHHHDRDRQRHDKVVVNGSNDNVHMRRSPHDRHDDDHHGKVIVNGDDDHVDVHHRRAGIDPSVSDNNGPPRMIARDGQQTVGVPGSIDIMSEDPSSENALKIASLVLSAPTNGTATGSNSTMSSFVLNASGSDHTQMFLVATDTGNSTSSGGSTSADNSTSTDPSFVEVALQIPVFNAEAAQMESFCATFDPNPPAPAPLTVEQCMTNSTAGGAHKSQVFAYEPATGIIRPMWSSNGSDPDSGLDPVSGPDNSTSPSITNANSSSTSTSSVSTAAASSTASASATANSTSDTAPMGTNLAQDIVKTLEDDWAETDTPSSRASAKIFDANSFSQARNVTLVFTPAAPMVASAGSLKAVVPASTGSDTGDANGDDSGTDDGGDSDDDDDGDDLDDDGSDSDDDDDDDGSSGANGANSTSIAPSTMTSGTSSTLSSTMLTASSAVTDTASSTLMTAASTGVFSDPAAKIASASMTSAAPSSMPTSSSGDAATAASIDPNDSMATTTDSTATATNSATMSSTISAQDPSLAVEVYDPDATASATDSDSSTVSASDSSTSTASTMDSIMTASGTDASSSVVPTSSASLVARQMSLANDSAAATSSTMSANSTSTMEANSTGTASATSVEVTGFAGKFREGTVVPAGSA